LKLLKGKKDQRPKKRFFRPSQKRLRRGAQKLPEVGFDAKEWNNARGEKQSVTTSSEKRGSKWILTGKL